MRNKAITKDFYVHQLGFQTLGNTDYAGYLMVYKDDIQLHFFEYAALDPRENYGQVYIRTSNIQKLYQEALAKKLPIPAAGHLQTKAWQQQEFSLLDPDHNLLTFGQAI